MGYFPVRYDSRVVNYDRRGFIRLATVCCNQLSKNWCHFGFLCDLGWFCRPCKELFHDSMTNKSRLNGNNLGSVEIRTQGCKVTGLQGTRPARQRISNLPRSNFVWDIWEQQHYLLFSSARHEGVVYSGKMPIRTKLQTLAKTVTGKIVSNSIFLF